MGFFLKKSDRIILVVGICVGCIAVVHPLLVSFVTSQNSNGRLAKVNGKPIKLENVEVKVPELQQGQTKINLNESGAETLAELPGIGPVLADRIVKHREEAGKFASVDELTKVNGIGSAKLGQIKQLVKV